MGSDAGLVPTLRGDVDELQSPRRDPLGKRWHVGKTVSRRAGADDLTVPGPGSPAPERGHNPPVTTRQPDPAPGAAPERGFVLGVFAKGVDGEEELAELRELARTAGVEPVTELVQHRERPDRRTFVGKG